MERFTITIGGMVITNPENQTRYFSRKEKSDIINSLDKESMSQLVINKFRKILDKH